MSHREPLFFATTINRLRTFVVQGRPAIHARLTTVAAAGRSQQAIAGMVPPALTTYEWVGGAMTASGAA